MSRSAATTVAPPWVRTSRAPQAPPPHAATPARRARLQRRASADEPTFLATGFRRPRSLGQAPLPNSLSGRVGRTARRSSPTHGPRRRQGVEAGAASSSQAIAPTRTQPPTARERLGARGRLPHQKAHITLTPHRSPARGAAPRRRGARRRRGQRVAQRASAETRRTRRTRRRSCLFGWKRANLHVLPVASRVARSALARVLSDSGGLLGAVQANGLRNGR